MRSIRSRAVGGFIACLLVAALAGSASAQSASPSMMAGSLAGTDWLLTSVGSAPVASGVNADLLFTDAQTAGFAGCNRFFGTYTSDGSSTLTFGPIATTMKACDTATSAFETSYLTALATVATYSMGADGGLTLSDGSGTAVLTYGATMPASVEGPWNVTMVNNGTGGVAAVPEGIGATIAFNPDGTVEGFDGCNTFAGGYGVNDSAITIGPLMGTRMACDDATNTFAQQYLTALQAATTWAITSGALDLRDASGAQQVEATSAIGH